MPSARSASGASLTSEVRAPETLRAAKAWWLVSPVSPVLPETLTLVSLVVFVYSPTARVSLTVASTPSFFSSWMACTNPSTASTLQPAPDATLLQLLVEDCAQTLPFRWGKVVMPGLSARVTITPSEVV